MQTKPPNHYRASALELSFEEQLHSLREHLLMFGMVVKSNLPAINLPDLSCPARLIFTGMKLPNDLMLEGRGPRFIAKYHLARSDEERQALLDSLPDLSQGTNSTIWGKLDLLTQDYRLVSFYNTYDARLPSQEWMKWSNKLSDEELFQVRECDLQVLAEEKNHPVDDDDNVSIPMSFDYFDWTHPPTEQRDRLGRLEIINHNSKKLVMLGVPEIMGYVVIEHVPMNHSGLSKIQPRWFSTLRWNKHELCWNEMPGDYIPKDIVEKVSKRYLADVGMPTWEEVTWEENVDLYTRLKERVLAEKEWLVDIFNRTGPIKSRTVTLANVLRLTFTSREGYYGNDNDMLVMSPLDDPADEHVKLPVVFNFANLWKDSEVPKPLFFIGAFNQKTEYLRIPPNHRRRINDLVQQFLEVPRDQLIVETVPREPREEDE
jgi:hypothetical protein